MDGKEYLSTGSVEDRDNSRDEDSEVPDNDQMDDNDPNNEPEIPLEELQVVPGHYKDQKETRKMMNKLSRKSSLHQIQYVIKLKKIKIRK